MKQRLIAISIIFFVALLTANAQRGRNTFAVGDSEFLLNRQPFQIISGELHPARIPAEYWRHRIQMAKAMGCNTITIPVFWNYHEEAEGVFDFETGNRNLAEFFRLAQQEQMWVIVKSNPHVGADWEFGGLPPYLLRTSDIELRSADTRYMAAVERYITRLSNVLRPHLITQGGTILMLQIENRYDNLLKANGIDIPTTSTLETGIVNVNTGGATYWGNEWIKGDATRLLNEVKSLMDSQKSFNLQVIHGGTNFGYTAGAKSDEKGYQPNITSYDNDALITEQGVPTETYMALRDIIGSYLQRRQSLSSIPRAVTAVDILAIHLMPFNSVWNLLSAPINSERPQPFEYYGQDYGFMVYRTELTEQKSGKLTITELHDYATVFLNGNYIGKIDRRLGENSIELPDTEAENTVLEIFVEAMGRISSDQPLADRKGITEKVTLNDITLTNWQVYNAPMDRKTIYDLRSSGRNLDKPGIIFKGSFMFLESGDTYIDLSNYEKGVVWINGHNLGRYWNIGPQTRLFCPASWLRRGLNEIIIFDLHQTTAQPVFGFKTLE